MLSQFSSTLLHAVLCRKRLGLAYLVVMPACLYTREYEKACHAKVVYAPPAPCTSTGEGLYISLQWIGYMQSTGLLGEGALHAMQANNMPAAVHTHASDLSMFPPQRVHAMRWSTRPWPHAAGATSPFSMRMVRAQVTACLPGGPLHVVREGVCGQ